MEKVWICHRFIVNQILRVPMEYRLEKICKFTQLEVTKLFRKYPENLILKVEISVGPEEISEWIYRL